MIELTEHQRQALASAEQPPRLRDPQTNEIYVLVPAAEYGRLQALEYDASPWTAEEMDMLAREAAELLDDYRSER